MPVPNFQEINMPEIRLKACPMIKANMMVPEALAICLLSIDTASVVESIFWIITRPMEIGFVESFLGVILK